MYITQKKKKKLYMINKIFSYFRRGIPLGREGRKVDWLIVGGLGVERERARMELGRLRKRCEG